MRPLAVLEQHILAILRKAPDGLNYIPIRAMIAKQAKMPCLPASRVIQHLQRLEALGLLTSHVEEGPVAPGTRAKRIYKIRPVPTETP